MLHASALLPDGRLLVADGGFLFGASPETISLLAPQIFNPVTGTWSAAATKTIRRKAATTTVMADGRVLVLGGFVYTGTSGPFGSGNGSIYDPATNTWSSAPQMNEFRTRHSAVLLQDGRVLAVGGGLTASSESFSPAAGTWSAIYNMLANRAEGHTATLLPDGRVFVEGGTTLAATSEIFNPTINTWSAGPSSGGVRMWHTATLLPNGKVLIAGGGTSSGGGSPLATALLYDPAANTYTATGSMTAARSAHTATLLPNGKVVVIGGRGSAGTLASAEVYDPATGTWSTTVSLAAARKYHSATLLADGRVVVVGGSNNADTVIAAVEIFTSRSPGWSGTGSMGATRGYTQAVTLSDGRVLVPGGQNGDALNTAEVYDPAAGTWSSAGTMISAHSEGTATLLMNGKVLVTGRTTSTDSSKTELYDPGAGTWTALPDLPVGRMRHTATLLPSGKVLLAGGGVGPSTKTCYLFDPMTNTWGATSNLGTARLWHTGTLLPNGKVLVAGGTDQFAMEGYATCEIYDPVTGTWSNTGSMAETRQRYSATLMPNGRVLVVGGLYMAGGTTPTPRATVEVFDPATGTWTSTGSLATARFDHRAELLADGRVLVAGGSDAGAALNSVEIYDPATGTWISGGTMGAGRSSSVIATLTTGKVLVAGGTSGNAGGAPYLDSAELFDPGLGFNAAWRPQVTAASIGGTRVLSITGTGLKGVSGASGGGVLDSSTSFPLVQIRSLGNSQIAWIPPAAWSATGFTSSVLSGFAPGHLLVTAFANGIPSESKVLLNPLGPEIDMEQPLGTGIADGGTKDFGSVTDGTGTVLVFTVKNSGPIPLSISGVSVTGGNAADFVVNTTGMSSSIAGGSSTTFSVTFTPSAAGSRTTTLQILSDDTDEGTYDITLTGTGLNAAPTISDIADQTINEDASTTALAFTIGDFETAAGSLTVTRGSSNTTLVPVANIVLGGSGASRTVTVTPAANLSGTATITVTVSDGALTASDTFTLTVNPVNDPPTLNAITNPAAILEDAGQQTVNLSGITAGGGETQTLSVSATSNNIALIPNPSVIYTSPNTTGSISYTPVANASGTATITVTVNDGQALNNTFSRTFNVAVTAVNDAPSISDIVNQTINEDTSTGPLAFTIGDLETAAGSLTVTRGSSNTTLVPVANIVFGGSGATRTVTVTPAANLSGTATITVTVSDGSLTASDTFLLTVNAVNDPPTITAIANQVITYNTLTNALGFTVGDVESAATSLTVTASSSNQTLLPDASVSLGGTDASRDVTLVPVLNQTGFTTITLTVSDGLATASTAFTLTVNAPEIAVEQPFGSNIVDGGTRGFGDVVVGSNSSVVFYIKNTNAAQLTGLGITKDGADPSQFVITATPVSPVAGPGGNTAFTVQFAPTSGGQKSCAIHIANNDPDESPFDITLTGKGIIPLSDWRQTHFGTTGDAGNAADLADPDGDGIVNLLEYAFGLHPGQNSAGQLPQPARVGGNLVCTFTEPPGVTGLTYGAEWSDSLASASWTSTGIDHAVSNGLHTFTLPAGTASQPMFIRLRVTAP